MSKTCKHCNGTGHAPDNAGIGSTLRKEREESGIGLRDMAALIGISHSFLVGLEQGKRTWKRSIRKRYEQVINKHHKQMHKHYAGIPLT
jgi:predicted transcriptional regulator